VASVTNRASPLSNSHIVGEGVYLSNMKGDIELKLTQCIEPHPTSVCEFFSTVLPVPNQTAKSLQFVPGAREHRLILAESSQLLPDAFLSVNFSDLGIFQFLPTSLPHLELLNGTHLLE
jgi:hypothetical protein